MSKVFVVAVSKKLNPSKEMDIYAYYKNKIFLYSPLWDLDINWDYESKIREIALQADQGIIEWVDIEIEDGQEITRKGNNIFIDGIERNPFNKLTDAAFANISPITTKIYNEFLKSRDKKDKELKDFLNETFKEGLFSKNISDIVEFNFQHAIEWKDLNNIDKQIIVRTRIEGYKFIIDFIKALLKGNNPRKIEYCEMFLSRVFILESQNYINF